MSIIRQAIASFLQLFVIFFFFSASLFFYCLAYLPRARLIVEDLLFNHSSSCVAIGTGFAAAAFLLSIGFYGIHRGKFLQIRMGKHLAEVDASLILETIEGHFKDKFAGKIHFAGVDIAKNGKLQISVELSEDGEKILEKLERELIPLLQSRFGYFKPFELIAAARSNA